VSGIDLAAFVQPTQAIARSASQRILAIYKHSFKVTEKADKTPLTEADMAAHNCIVESLQSLTPDIPVLSEEHVDIALHERSCWEWLWLVDPLDGTREFIKHSDEFCINIALIHNHVAVFGLILMPVSEVCYFAYRDGGAFKQLPGTEPQPIRTCATHQQPVRVAGGSSYARRPLKTYLEYVGQHHYTQVGSALKSCLVAEGKIDLYPKFGPTSEWDTAAAQVIVEQAGGRITDTFMRPLRYNARPTLLNPDFFVFGDPSKDWSQYLPRRKPRY